MNNAFHVQKCLKNGLLLSNTKRSRINAGILRLGESINRSDATKHDSVEVAESFFVIINGVSKEAMLKVSDEPIKAFFQLFKYVTFSFI